MSSDSNFSALLKFFCFSSQEKEASSTSHQFVENSEGAKHSTPSVSEWARSACCLCLVEEITRGFGFFCGDREILATRGACYTLLAIVNLLSVRPAQLANTSDSRVTRK